MKEIVHVQAGSFANYVGTHFWNTQESYFTYEDGDDPLVEHDRSFREGLNSKVEIFFFTSSLDPPWSHWMDILAGRSDILSKITSL